MLVNKDIISQLLFKNLFNEKQDGIDLIKKIIIGNTSSSVLEFIMYVMANPDFELLSPGDYFKCKLEDKHIGKRCEVDHLIDLGLYKDGYVYGKVLDSDDYGGTFEQCYPQMKVELLFHDEDIMMSPYKTTLETYKLIKLDKSNIKYFNHGAD